MSKVTDLTKRRYKIEERKLVSKNFNLPCHSFLGVMLQCLLVEHDGLQPSSPSNITKLNKEKSLQERKIEEKVSLQEPSSVLSFFAWCEDSISSCRLEYW